MTIAYDGKEWVKLTKQLSESNMRKSVKKGMYRINSKIVKIGRRYLDASGLQVKGSKSDFRKGLRGFVHLDKESLDIVTSVKAQKVTKNNAKERGMHKNRKGFKKPILMWAEDGTQPRKTKSKTKIYTRLRKGHQTGRMRKYGFLEKAAPEMYRTVENDLCQEIEKSVTETAKKCGFI